MCHKIRCDGYCAKFFRFWGHLNGALRGLKTYMPEMVEVLIDCVRNPAFLDWEVKEQVFHLGVIPFHMSVLV